MSRKPQMIFAILILLVVVSVGSVVVAGPTCAFCNERTVRCCDNGYKCTGCGEKDHTTCHLHKYQATSCTNIKKCSCGKTTGAHSYSVKEVSSKYLKSAMTCTSQAVYYYKCSGCSAKGTGTYKAGSYAGHDYEGTWSKDSTYHWHKCKNCSYQTGKMAHQYNGNLSICVSDKKCTDCGYVAQKALGHDYGTTYESDDNYHWIKCNRTGCNALKLKESHNKTGTCVCGYKSEIEIDYIDIENAPNFLKVGESAKLQVYISPENATNKIIGWGSSNSNIVSVKNGTIYGVAPGTAIIAAVSTTAYGKAKDSCKITVLAECSADGIIDSHGDACKTFYKWDYEDDEAGYNTHSLWWECTKCENEWKASTEQKQPHNLDGNGNCRDCGYPSGKKHTCDKKVELCLNELSTLTHHTLELSCSVCGERQGTKEEKHTAPNKDGKCSVCGTKLVYEPEVIYLNKNSVSLEIGKTFQLEAEIVPATVNTKNKITYISSNSSIVSVSSNGLVTAKKAGTVTVTVRTENGKTARCTVTVKVCGKDYTVSGHYGSKTTSFTNITSTTHDAVITCTKCGTSYTNKAIGHKYLNNNGTECPCGYKCAHSGEKSTTYTKKVYATHTKVVRCTVCKTEINSTPESHKFNKFGICDCGYKCPHTGETKKDYQLEREMVHKEITKCANCGKIIDTVRIPKTSNANDEFDSTYTYISNNKHKIYLKCKTCNFTYNGEGSCTSVKGVCKFCNKKITSCSDKTHNHKLICDGKSTPYHKLYYKCDKLNITWEYDRDKMNLLIQSGEDICIACNKCMHISNKTNYITSADGHIKQEICKNSKCNKIVSTSTKENHNFANGVCTVCKYECTHTSTTNEAKYKNESEHEIWVACANCDVKKMVEDEPHDENLELLNVNWTNKEKHNILVKCSCGKFSKTEEHKYDDKTGECICGRSKDEEEKKCTKITVTSSTITAKTGNLISLRKYLKIEPASAKLNLKWYSSTRGKIELRANGNLIAKEKSNNIIVTVVDEVTGKSATIKVKAEGSNVEEPEKKEYVDVSKDSWYKENVDKATSEGMFNGVSDDKFAPEDNVTRGMFVTALARMDKADTKGYANLFDDVSDKAYYSESIAWASVNGIVNGIGNGKFAPEALMTREEMAVMIRNYINVQYNDVYFNTELASISAIETFADDDNISSWAKSAVYSLAEMGLLNGKGNGNFAPQDKVTRAEAATILVRLSEKMTVEITEK